MNRKFLLIVLTLAVVLLATPYIGTASAGKGQNKLDFEFILVGHYIAPGRVVETKNTLHLFDFPFVASGWPGPTPPAELPLRLLVNGVPINPALLSYAGMMHVNVNGNSETETISVEETITIKASDGSVRGTLELHVMGNINQGNGVGAGNNFIGFGTGAFEGVKISGSTVGPVSLGTLEPVPGVTITISRLDRVGTVMGWP